MARGERHVGPTPEGAHGQRSRCLESTHPAGEAGRRRCPPGVAHEAGRDRLRAVAPGDGAVWVPGLSARYRGRTDRRTVRGSAEVATDFRCNHRRCLRPWQGHDPGAQDLRLARVAAEDLRADPTDDEEPRRSRPSARGAKAGRTPATVENPRDDASPDWTKGA